MAARDILVLARRTAGVSQAELGARLGRPRSTIARWELGEMQPSYAAVAEAIEACGLSATLELAGADGSYLGHVGEMLRLPPIDRVRRLGGARRAEQLAGLAEAGVDAIVFGDVAGALCGWPLTLPATGPLELCSARRLDEDLGDVDVVERPPGTRGMGDLRRDRERIDLGDARRAWIASPLDLLRIERARRRHAQVGALAAVLEHRRRWPDGPPPARHYTDEQAASAIDAWLTARA